MRQCGKLQHFLVHFLLFAGRRSSVWFCVLNNAAGYSVLLLILQRALDILVYVVVFLLGRTATELSLGFLKARTRQSNQTPKDKQLLLTEAKVSFQ
jgi:hypothetical protein